MRITVLHVDAERDELTLRDVVQPRYDLLVQCWNCKAENGVDILNAVHKFGPNVTIAKVRAALRCRVCNKTDPAARLVER